MSGARTGQAGFTLLEILIALGIMAFGIATVIGLFAAATATHQRAMDNQTAALLAESVVADWEAALTLDFDVESYPLAPAPAAADPIPIGAPLNGSVSGDQTYLVVDNQMSRLYPGTFYSVYLTPLEPLDDQPPLAYVVEVEIGWRDRGKLRRALFQTVLLKQLAVQGAPAP